MAHRGRRRHVLGVSMIEFALIGPLVFLLVYGIVEMGRAAYDANVMSNAAREGARAAVAAQEADNSSAGIQSDVLAAVRRTLGGGINLSTTVRPITTPCAGALPGVATVYMSPSPGTMPGGTANPKVTVEVCYSFRPMLGLVSAVVGNHILLDSSSTMKTEY